MCGIFGYFSKEKTFKDLSVIQSMGNIIDYRGPDGQGIFNHAGVALGNQRLAILDVAHGQQPFISNDGKIVVVQNGEIFNHIEIANELQGTAFECLTHCDTEVILRLYEQDGISALSKLNGMFAIAIYDANIDELFLIRDRVGEKPLYYYYDNDLVVFGSEIKSILEFGIKIEVNYDAIDSFLTFNYVAPPLTMFQNIMHVMPGSYLRITRQGVHQHQWWDLLSIPIVDKTETQWITEFNDILSDSVSMRLRADVPFGAFLSGGVDSSTVVGLMSQHMSQPVKTFTIGFHDPLYDESEFAQAVASRFSTEHIMEKVDPNLLSFWPKATYHCDQPHGDVSFMPTYRVAQLAANTVKMVLTGDGADELFAGYDKYKNFFTDDSCNYTDELFREQYFDSISLFNKTEKYDLYSDDFRKYVNIENSHKLIEKKFEESKHMDRINQALYIDTTLLLSGNNLVKPDRMGMAVSIENRAPFLDYRMIELAFSMPGSLKLKNGETKYIYKKAVSELIGFDLAYRKKQMFTVPIGNWLIHELRDMVIDLLLSEKVRARKIFDYELIATMYKHHCSGIKNYTREIRALMALEIWFREFAIDFKVE
ncbi:asparagine synthase (glutamine-hydrolyzing) [Aeromonas schubertii]|uniref:asparagine synthase (glutamine-hydrolyzing) n=1 Tax=Aeromonas schubertii TaxID=652 RepID=UPI0010A837E7|nr:asparagine synthase (glutamine-hydrolyzing) [Aeromonas schubertii]QCG47892.1 asparagine synthase (glutamine-hydrolyzing) [Aeromonas schubertii]